MRDRAGEDGIAIVLALLAVLLMSALGTALVLTTSSETVIAGNFRNAREGLYAADAGLERAMDEIGTMPDWNALLDGSTQSAFADGVPGGVRTLPDGSPLNFGELVNVANCQKAATCSAPDLTANTTLRPWGANNPVWRLYAYGPLSRLLPNGVINSPFYVVVMAADDPSENDNDPTHDGHSQTNAGTGVLALRAEAFGPRGAHKVVQATVARTGPAQAGLRVMSWREVR